MYWFPRPTGDFPLSTFLVVLGILALCLTILWWDRRRKRNDPDRGGPGYTATAVRATPLPDPGPNPVSADERWLLGFAAPRIVPEEGLDPERWDLGSHIHERPVSTSEAIEWRAMLTRLEQEFARAATPADRALAAVELAWWIRRGVASRQIAEAAARDATRVLAESMRSDADDWLGFGDLLGERPGMTRPRDLYKPGAPWADAHWPG